MEQNKEMENGNIIINKEITPNQNKTNSNDEELFFYVMTLQTDNGEKQEIKIYENSNASELAFNYCRIYNLDFETMKYIKKCIKQIKQQFKENKDKDMIYFVKDNNSIQELAEEEIITENSLKRSGTTKKSNNKIYNNNQSDTKNEEKKEEKIEKILQLKEENNNNLDKKNENKEKNIEEKYDLKEQKEKEIYEYDIIKSKNIFEDEGYIEQKEYSIDYCLDNESIEIISPTEHTTKIEQRSSIRNNSSSLNKKGKYDKYILDKKNHSKNKKFQNNKNINLNIIYNKPIYKTNYSCNKSEKESNNIKKYIKNEFKSNNKKSFTKKNSLNKDIKKKPKSIEKSFKMINNRTPILELSQNNRRTEVGNKNTYINKYEKFKTNINEMKKKYFSNYFNYFMKSKNICNKFNRNNLNPKYKISSSLNQDSNNKSKTLSQNKISKNFTQKSLHKSRERKDKDINMSDFYSFNFQNMNNSSKINLNTIIKKENHSKDKKRTVLRNKMTQNYNTAYSNNVLFNKSKTINKKTSSSKRKKGSQRKDLFFDSKTKKINSNTIRKMVATSLLNIHKLKESQENKKQSIATERVIKGLQNKNKINKNRELFNKLFRNESNIEKNNNHDKYYYEFRNKHNNNLSSRNRRHNTEINVIQNKNCIKNDIKGRVLTSHKHI